MLKVYRNKEYLVEGNKCYVECEDWLAKALVDGLPNVTYYGVDKEKFKHMIQIGYIKDSKTIHAFMLYLLFKEKLEEEIKFE